MTFQNRFRPIRRPGLRVGVFAALAFAVTAAQGADCVVRVTLLDGSSVAGVFERIERQSIYLIVEGESEALALDDINDLDFGGTRRGAATTNACQVQLAGGGSIAGSVGAAADGGLLLRSPLLGELTIPFDRAATVRFNVTDANEQAAEALFTERAADRLRAQDVLITRDESPKALRGTLVEFGPSASRFVYNDRERTLQTDKILGVVLADTGAGAPRDHNARIVLTHDQSLRCRITASTDDALIVDAGFAKPVTVPLGGIVRIELESSRVAYLSDMSFASRKYAGVVQSDRTIRMDRSVANQTMRLDGQVYAKGVGMQAGGEIVYDLDEAYESLAATIGIDDEAGDAGSVVFRVLIDGEEVIAKRLNARDKPVDIVAPLAGARRVTLIADDAGDTDVADWADWALIRLIRPKSSS